VSESTGAATFVETAPRPRFETTGGPMAYTDVGSGPPVLLLHGFPFWSIQWRHFLPALAARFRVIAPDLLGAGESAMPEDRPIDIAAQAGYVRELLDHLEIGRFAVVAHGTGGAVAQLLAIDLRGVAALVLLAPSSLEAPAPPAGLRALVRRAATGEIHATMRSILSAGVEAHGRITDELIDAYARPYADAPAALQRAALGDGAFPRPADPAGIQAPVLILWGEEDPFAPTEEADRLNEAIASSTLGLLPGCGHFLPDEAPETLAPMVAEYLRAMYLRAPHGHAGDGKDGVVMLQLERRPPWVDLAEDEADDWFVDDDDEEPPT
jgi:pimeloyl-ACP methyl ester carboxylesterase